MVLKKRKTEISSYEQFLKTCENQKDMIIFESPQEAYEYGNKLRDVIAKEQGVDNWFDCEGIAVEISGQVVRMKILELEPVCV